MNVTLHWARDYYMTPVALVQRGSRNSEQSGNCFPRASRHRGEQIPDEWHLHHEDDQKHSEVRDLIIGFIAHSDYDSQHSRAIEWRNGNEVEETQQQTQLRKAKTNLPHLRHVGHHAYSSQSRDNKRQ